MMMAVMTATMQAKLPLVLSGSRLASLLLDNTNDSNCCHGHSYQS